VSFLLAGFSWKFVEGPFRGRRGRNTFSRRQIFAAGVLGSMLLAGLGGLLYRKQGLPSRFSSQVLAMYASKNDRWNRWGEWSGKICPIGNTAVTPSFVLWGDSHAAAIAPLFEHLATVNNVSGFTAFDGSCVPLLGAKHYEEGTVERCARFQDSILTFIQTRHIRNVYLHARWAIYCEGTRYHQEEGLPVLLTANRNPRQNYAEFEYLFRSTIQELRRRQVNVVVIASVPEVGTDVPTALARSAARGLSVELRPRLSDFMERQARTFGVLSRVAAQNAVRVVYPHETFCDSSLCILTKENNILYMDDNHLSVHGAMLLASAVTPFLEKALSRGLQ